MKEIKLTRSTYWDHPVYRYRTSRAHVDVCMSELSKLIEIPKSTLNIVAVFSKGARTDAFKIEDYIGSRDADGRKRRNYDVLLLDGKKTWMYPSTYNYVLKQIKEGYNYVQFEVAA